MALPLIVGNWKMHGHQEMAFHLVKEIAHHLQVHKPPLCVVMCPPAIFIPQLVQMSEDLGGFSVGGQDCHVQESGAFTGDVSANMFADAGARYVIVGHSERRAAYHETDEMVAAKAQAVRDAGLIPIICVGETLNEMEKGRTMEVVERQILAAVPAGVQDEVVIAYEPVWAIGTGKIPSLNDIEMVHGAIIGCLAQERGIDAGQVTVLYGGSVKPSNAYDIANVAGVGGMLVGGASVNAVEFCAILSAVAQAESGV